MSLVPMALGLTATDWDMFLTKIRIQVYCPPERKNCVWRTNNMKAAQDTERLEQDNQLMVQCTKTHYKSNTYLLSSK